MKAYLGDSTSVETCRGGSGGVVLSDSSSRIRLGPLARKRLYGFMVKIHLKETKRRRAACSHVYPTGVTAWVDVALRRRRCHLCKLTEDR